VLPWLTHTHIPYSFWQVILLAQPAALKTEEKRKNIFIDLHDNSAADYRTHHAGIADQHLINPHTSRQARAQRWLAGRVRCVVWAVYLRRGGGGIGWLVGAGRSLLRRARFAACSPTAGVYCRTAFVRSLARSVNSPVRNSSVCAVWARWFCGYEQPYRYLVDGIGCRCPTAFSSRRVNIAVALQGSTQTCTVSPFVSTVGRFFVCALQWIARSLLKKPIAVNICRDHYYEFFFFGFP